MKASSKIIFAFLAAASVAAVDYPHDNKDSEKTDVTVLHEPVCGKAAYRPGYVHRNNCHNEALTPSK